MSLEVEKSNTVVELFDAVRGLARVKIATKHNAAKEAGFLYWSLGHITKIPKLFPPEYAFYALYTILPESEDTT